MCICENLAQFIDQPQFGTSVGVSSRKTYVSDSFARASSKKVQKLCHSNSPGNTEKCIRETKAGYYQPGLALLTLRYQLKTEGCLFVSVFSADGFSGRGRTPSPHPCRYRKINNAVLFSSRKACTACLCGARTHAHAASGCLRFSDGIKIRGRPYVPLISAPEGLRNSLKPFFMPIRNIRGREDHPFKIIWNSRNENNSTTFYHQAFVQILPEESP